MTLPKFRITFICLSLSALLIPILASRPDHLVLYRPGTGSLSILQNINGIFVSTFSQPDPGNGIGGHDLKSIDDRVFAFDYDHSGHPDHIVGYRPGTGGFWVLRNTNDRFDPIYQSDSGVAGYNLRSLNDRAIAFDYNGCGYLDHLLLYRPGTGAIWILQNNNGHFTPLYHEGDPGNGIGGFDLKSVNDRVIAFDYDHSGKMDHLVLFRPGKGLVYILKNRGGGAFVVIYGKDNIGTGIGGYAFDSPLDRMFAFDYAGTGKNDHLFIYRPGSGTVWILANCGGSFTPVYKQDRAGIAGYDVKSQADRIFAFDYDRSGKEDHFVIYRPGTGSIWIVMNTKGVFTGIFKQPDPGQGIGGYDLKSARDLIFPIDYVSSGGSDSAQCRNPGQISNAGVPFANGGTIPFGGGGGVFSPGNVIIPGGGGGGVFIPGYPGGNYSVGF